MATQEHTLRIEIVCTQLPPAAAWDSPGKVHLGIQREQVVVNARPADRAVIVLHSEFRVRRNADGSANFLGPFAQGRRSERFVYLVWLTMAGNVLVGSPGRVKLHLNHIQWVHVEKAVTRKMPVKVTVPLTNDKGKPVFASMRNDRARWQL